MENFELVENPETTYKVCGKCKESKTILPNFSVHFRKDRNRRTISVNCKECVKTNSANWYKTNKHTEDYKKKSNQLKIKAKENGTANQWAKDRYAKYKKIVFDYYGNKCSCCGENHIEFLTIEHTLHNGKEHRATKRSTIYKDIIDKGFPEDLTLFCSNCNFATRYGNECPHQVEKFKNNLLVFKEKLK